MKLHTVSRLTGPQLAEALDKLGAKPIEQLKKTIATAEPGTQEFVDGVAGRLSRDGDTVRSASTASSP